MRLICPNCDAQYEVPDDVIPAEGRDVQCSSCGHTWFEPHPLAQEPEPEPLTLESAPEEDWDEEDYAEPAAAPEPKPRELDPEIASVLREEAERESRVRAEEALESQPELGLDGSAPEAPVAEREERRARLRQDPPEEHVFEETQLATAAAASARGGLLPDVEEINSTLRSRTEPREVATPQGMAQIGEDRSGGFGRGFRLALSLVLFAAAIYLFAPQVKTALPEAGGVLDGYVEAIDSGRHWLDEKVDAGLLWLDGFSSEAAEAEEVQG